MRGSGSPAGRLGKRTAARAPGLARPSAGPGNAAGAAKNVGASGVCEFSAELRPPPTTGHRTGRWGSPPSYRRSRRGGRGRNEGARPPGLGALVSLLFISASSQGVAALGQYLPPRRGFELHCKTHYGDRSFLLLARSCIKSGAKSRPRRR